MSLFDIWLGILQGLGTTAAVTAYGLVFAVPFALVFGIAQYLTQGVARLLVTGVIEFWRSSAVISGPACDSARGSWSRSAIENSASVSAAALCVRPSSRIA